MKTKQRVERNSSIELLRIITMYLIVLNHFASHGGFAFEAQTLSIPRFCWNFLVMGGRPLLWKRIFENARYQNSLKIIPYSIAVEAFVFVVCTIVELLRQRVFALIFKSR